MEHLAKLLHTRELLARLLNTRKLLARPLKMTKNVEKSENVKKYKKITFFF